jgi:DNA polymerase
MGNSAIHSLIETEKTVTDLHGIPFEAGDLTYFPMYHPAAALYTFQLKKTLEEDFRKLRALLDYLSA